MTESNRHRIRRRLDRLESDRDDLGAIPGDHKDQFYRRFLAELARRIARFKAAYTTGSREAGHDAARATEPLQVFLFCLTQGRLPWWGTQPSEGWSEALLTTLDDAGWAVLRDTVRTDSSAGVRLIDSVSDGFLDAAVAAWTRTSGAIHVLTQLRPVGLDTAALRQWRWRFWAVLLDWALLEEAHAQRGPELMHNLQRLGEEIAAGNEKREPLHDSEKPAQTDERSSLPQPWCSWQAQSKLAER